MSFEPFIQDYFDCNPDFYKKVEALEKRVGKKLFRKLKNNKSQTNFHSWLSEMRFGLFFNKFCEVKYDTLIDRKTPDWTLIMNDQKILAEVARINVEEDELRQIYEFAEELKIHNQQNLDKPKRYMVVPPKTFLSSAYLYNHQSKITAKEKNYAPIINKYQIPFIICISPISNTYLNQYDVFDFLIGSNKKGLFYTDHDFGRNVTGVLFEEAYEQIYYNNENSYVTLNEQNQTFFQSITFVQPNW